MQIKPNETVLDGVVRRIDHARDGIGATVAFSVLKNHASDPAADFVGAPVGATLDLFAAVPQEFEVGEHYRTGVHAFLSEKNWKSRRFNSKRTILLSGKKTLPARVVLFSIKPRIFLHET